MSLSLEVPGERPYSISENSDARDYFFVIRILCYACNSRETRFDVYRSEKSLVGRLYLVAFALKKNQ